MTAAHPTLAEAVEELTRLQKLWNTAKGPGENAQAWTAFAGALVRHADVLLSALQSSASIQHRADCELLTVPTFGLCTCDFDKRASPATIPEGCVVVPRAREIDEMMVERAAMAYLKRLYPDERNLAATPPFLDDIRAMLKAALAVSPIREEGK